MHEVPSIESVGTRQQYMPTWRDGLRSLHAEAAHRSRFQRPAPLGLVQAARVCGQLYVAGCRVSGQDAKLTAPTPRAVMRPS